MSAPEGASALSDKLRARIAGDESATVLTEESIRAGAERFLAIFDKQNAGRTAEGSYLLLELWTFGGFAEVNGENTLNPY
jgi:hypothetical protein